MKKILLFLLLALITFQVWAQKGGLPSYPVLSLDSAKKNGYILINNSDSLVKYAKISNSKIFITGSFSLKERVVISGNNVIIEGDKRYTISSNLWYSTFRFFESFDIEGKNVVMKGLNLKGSDCDIRTLDTMWYQTGIRCHADSFHIINCNLSCWGWCAVYGQRYQGLLVDQCYISHNKNYGYGYAVWFEGSSKQYGVVSNCIMEDNREGIDAGGQKNIWSAIGNISDRGFTSHNDPNNQGGLGIYYLDNMFYPTGNVGTPIPSSDSGFLVVRNNYFMGDSNSVWITGVNPKAKIIIENNHYKGEGMNLPVCSVKMDSIIGGRAYLSLSSTGENAINYYQIYWGDGSGMATAKSNKTNHKYVTMGTYDVLCRSVSSSGKPSQWVRQKVVYKSLTQKTLSCAIKSTARFLPKKGYYKISLLIDSVVKVSYDATNIYKWKRLAFPISSGKHTIILKAECTKLCPYNILFWVDDFDVDGEILNSGLEDAEYYQVPVSYWRQGFNGVGLRSIGSGIDSRESCSGDKSWRFEFRGTDSIPAGVGCSATFSQQIVVK